MNRRGIRTFVSYIGLAVILLGILLSAGCTSLQAGPASTPAPSPAVPDGDENTPITIAATIPPLRQFVEAVGGERVSVMVMVPPGASPHTHEPTPGQLRSLADTDVYVEVGSGIEFETVWMDRMLAMNQNMGVIDTSEGITLISSGGNGGDSGTDPHIWTSPANAEQMVRIIEKELSRLYPAYADEFSKGADDYIARLETLDAEIRTSLGDGDARPVMVYHPAWAYFATEYNIPLIVIEEDGKEPSPAHLQAMIDRARVEGITTIIASPEQTSRSAEVIARETGSRIIYISSLEEDYLSTMDRMAEAVVSP